jgi:hypothetical protein
VYNLVLKKENAGLEGNIIVFHLINYSPLKSSNNKKRWFTIMLLLLISQQL